MVVSAEDIARVRDAGRRQRRLTRAQRRRVELGPVIDTGMLDDDDVKVLFDAYTEGKREEPDNDDD